jgi:sRNA-binding carbon storage regulator CsrA
MIALEVCINGKCLTVAGREDLCALSALVDAVGDLGDEQLNSKNEGAHSSFFFNIVGVTSSKDGHGGSHLNWLPSTKIKPGDEITIKVITTNHADRPVKIETPKTSAINNKERWQAAKDFYQTHKKDFE